MSWLDVFIKIHNFTKCLKVTFQQMCVISSEATRGTEDGTGRKERVLFHIEVRTLYARRMFRESGLSTKPWTSQIDRTDDKIESMGSTAIDWQNWPRAYVGKSQTNLDMSPNPTVERERERDIKCWGSNF